MRIGELFAGIGGLGIAAQWTLGGSVAWQADLVGEKVRRRHFPEAVQVVGDVCSVDPRRLEPVDVLCAGFACQDLSVAGPQASKEDLHAGARTGTTYRETLRFVDTLRPRFVVLENVPALLNHRATLERDLAGYGLTWVVCGAYHVGAPHRRMRVFVLGELGARGAGLVEAPTAAQWSPVESEREWTTITASESKGRRTSLARRDDPDMLSEQVRPWASLLAADDAKGSDPKGARQGSPGLVDAIRMWPTPVCADARAVIPTNWPGPDTYLNVEASQRVERIRQPGQQPWGSRLNPDWVELLMGYPIGWTRPEGERLTPERSPQWPRGRYPEGWDRSQPWQGFSWEPPRTLPDGPPAPGRPAQLAALGNAVHPQQGHLALTTAMQPQQLGLFFAPAAFHDASPR